LCQERSRSGEHLDTLWPGCWKTAEFEIPRVCRHRNDYKEVDSNAGEDGNAFPHQVDSKPSSSLFQKTSSYEQEQFRIKDHYP